MHQSAKLVAPLHRPEHKPGELVEIIDAALFLRCTQSLLMPRREAKRTQQEAADLLGLDQATVSRLVSDKYVKVGRRIRAEVWNALRAKLPDPWGDAIVEATLSNNARAAIDDYDDWVLGELQRILGRHHIAEDLEAEMRSTPGVREEFARFENAAKRAGWEPDSPRVRLAILRVAEPLVHGEGWGIEQTLEEMAETRALQAYVAASLKRELLLLRRDGDLSRAQAWAGHAEARSETRRAERQRIRSAEYDRKLDQDWDRRHGVG